MKRSIWKNINKVLIGLVLGSAIAGLWTAGYKAVKNPKSAIEKTAKKQVVKAQKLANKTKRSFFSKLLGFWKLGVKEMKKSMFKKS